jgi:1-acyl-sn-glycerol-3-phosphate acyltransferase
LLFLRSLAFNILFYLNLIAFVVFGSWLLLLPRSWAMQGLKTWSRSSLWWLEVIAGIDFELRGAENLPKGAALVAGKHQSMWETVALYPLFDDPTIVLKRELMWLPLMGWFAKKFGMLPIDRAAGGPALKRLLRRAEEAARAGRQIIIFPEGTRRAPDAPPDYKAGATALYLRLGVPCVPFALNSGLFWPRRSFWRRPGTIVVEFLPTIPPGLSRHAFESKLKEAIEPATARLVAEGK